MSEQQIGEQLFRLMIEGVKDYAIFMIDPDRRHPDVELRGRAFEGITAEEIIGKHLSCFYEPEDIRDRRPQRLMAMVKTHGRVEDEGWHVRKDGARFWADVILTAMYGEGGAANHGTYRAVSRETQGVGRFPRYRWLPVN